MAAELVGNVVSVEVEGSSRCVHSRACGQTQDSGRRLQADRHRVLQMGEVSGKTVFLDISSMFIWMLSELYCCPCSGPHV